jgi:hypothetical protein
VPSRCCVLRARSFEQEAKTATSVNAGDDGVAESWDGVLTFVPAFQASRTRASGCHMHGPTSWFPSSIQQVRHDYPHALRRSSFTSITLTGSFGTLHCFDVYSVLAHTGTKKHKDHSCAGALSRCSGLNKSIGHFSDRPITVGLLSIRAQYFRIFAPGSQPH